MKDFLILFTIGLLCAVGGVLLWKRENRMFGKSVSCRGTVVGYDEYVDSTDVAIHHPVTKYTMLVEYTLGDESLIRAKEQSGSTDKKYPVGEDIPITYSLEKPDMFIVTGDKSRRIGLLAMIGMGVVLVVISFFLPRQ